MVTDVAFGSAAVSKRCPATVRCPAAIVGHPTVLTFGPDVVQLTPVDEPPLAPDHARLELLRDLTVLDHELTVRQARRAPPQESGEADAPIRIVAGVPGRRDDAAEVTERG